MAIVSRGFHRRDRPDDRPGDEARLPPGQTIVADWPVLSAGPTPNIHPGEWRFTVQSGHGERHEWGWDDFLALGVEDVTVDIHCVTHWSKLGMSWRGVPVDRVLAAIEVDTAFAMVSSFGGYTTNLPLEDLAGGKAWVATHAEGRPLTPEHGGPARLLVPHLYFWKSAKWVNGIRLMPRDEPGFWERYGYNMHGDPWKEERYS